MKIAIDISQVVYGTGVSIYTKKLIENLLKIDNNNEYILFGGSLRRRVEIYAFLKILKKGFYKSKIFPIPPQFSDLIWNKLHIINIENLIGKVDVLHSSDWVQPPTKAFKVTTVHDLVWFKYPELSNPKIVKVHKSRMKWISQEVDRIIVPSKTTKNDLIHYGIKSERIRIIPEAVDPIFRHANNTQIAQIKTKYKISDNYLFSVGINHRKNTEGIIKVFRELRKIKKYHNLVLIFTGYPYLKLSQEKGVRILGHIPQKDLPILYSGAEVFIFPSLYEGFGLPILEAFACKIPVVTSGLGSMKEIAGDAAILVDPYDINSIKEGIEKAIINREKYVKRGSDRLKQYSWEKTAKMTLDVYNEAL